MDALYWQVKALAALPVILLLIGAILLLSRAFAWRRKTLGIQNRILDSRLWYTPADAHQFFQAIGARGRRLYAVTQITLDVLFPLAYGTLLATLIVSLCDEPYARLLVLAPLLTAAADLLENITTAYLAFRFNDQVSSLASAAASFTAAKWSLFSLSLIIVFIEVFETVMRTYNFA